MFNTFIKVVVCLCWNEYVAVTSENRSTNTEHMRSQNVSEFSANVKIMITKESHEKKILVVLVAFMPRCTYHHLTFMVRSVICTMDFWMKASWWCEQHGMLLAHRIDIEIELTATVVFGSRQTIGQHYYKEQILCRMAKFSGISKCYFNCRFCFFGDSASIHWIYFILNEAHHIWRLTHRAQDTSCWLLHRLSFKIRIKSIRCAQIVRVDVFFPPVLVHFGWSWCYCWNQRLITKHFWVVYWVLNTSFVLSSDKNRTKTHTNIYICIVSRYSNKMARNQTKENRRKGKKKIMKLHQ